MVMAGIIQCRSAWPLFLMGLNPCRRASRPLVVVSAFVRHPQHHYILSASMTMMTNLSCA